MTGTFGKPTKRAINRALKETAKLVGMTPRERAVDRLERAKRAFSNAAAAALQNTPGAAGMADVAMKEVERARAALAALDAAAEPKP
ncbi:MAG TPA: hypothetical protein VHP37_06900 [Burkholderiales bacterium]|nr:hypothetical protein [Burkholderiales bacterium]